jgi:hypothetical protein
LLKLQQRQLQHSYVVFITLLMLHNQASFTEASSAVRSAVRNLVLYSAMLYTGINVGIAIIFLCSPIIIYAVLYCVCACVFVCACMRVSVCVRPCLCACVCVHACECVCVFGTLLHELKCCNSYGNRLPLSSVCDVIQGYRKRWTEFETAIT